MRFFESPCRPSAAIEGARGAGIVPGHYGERPRIGSCSLRSQAVRGGGGTGGHPLQRHARAEALRSGARVQAGTRTRWLSVARAGHAFAGVSGCPPHSQPRALHAAGAGMTGRMVLRRAEGRVAGRGRRGRRGGDAVAMRWRYGGDGRDRGRGGGRADRWRMALGLRLWRPLPSLEASGSLVSTSTHSPRKGSARGEGGILIPGSKTHAYSGASLLGEGPVRELGVSGKESSDAESGHPSAGPDR